MSAHVYMLRCADGSYYVGSARYGLDRRLGEHNEGHYRGYTSNRLPAVLVFSQEFDRIEDAIAAERGIKGWSRAKKEALIRGDFALLSTLAQSRQKQSGQKQSGQSLILRQAQDEENP